MYYTVIKHSGHLRTLEKCRKHEPQASVFYISLVFSNARRVLSWCNTRLRLLYFLNNERNLAKISKLPKRDKLVITTMVVLNAIEIDATFVEISSWNLNHFQVFRRAKNTPFILDSLVIQKMLFIWPHARNVVCNMWGPPPLISE